MEWKNLIHDLPYNCQELIWKQYMKHIIIPDINTEYNKILFKKNVLPCIRLRSSQILASMFINNVLNIFNNNKDKYKNIIFEEDTLDLVYEMLMRREDLLVSEKYYKDFMNWALITKFSRMEP